MTAWLSSPIKESFVFFTYSLILSNINYGSYINILD